MAISKFNSFFRSKLVPELRPIERARRRIPLRAALLGLGAAVAAWLAWRAARHVVFPWFFTSPTVAAIANAGVLAILRDIILALSILLAAIIAVTFWAREFLFPSHIWEAIFSRNVVRKTVDFAQPGLRNEPGQGVRQGDFRDSRLGGGSYFGYYHGRDLFEGELSACSLRFSWVEAQYGAGGNERPNAENRFRGWFFVATFPRKFRGDTRVYRDTAENWLGWFGRSLQSTIIPIPYGLELIQLEDPDFERRFKVLADSQLDARHVLSPSFMRQVVALQRKVRAPLSLSFRSHQMYAAFPCNVHYFDTFRPHSFLDPAFTRQLFQAVEGVRALAEALAREYRMWDMEMEQNQESTSYSHYSDRNRA